MQSKPTTITLSNGLHCSGTLYTTHSDASRPEDCRIIAVHGWLDNAGSFEPLAKHLLNQSSNNTSTHESRVTLLAIDLPGHGRSDPLPPSQTYQPWDFVLALADVADKMAWPEFILLGHSMGAHVCYLYAACFKDRVRKLIVVESVGHVNRIQAGGDTAAMREFLDKRRKFDREWVERGLDHGDGDKGVGVTNVDPFKATTLYASVEDAARARMNGATKVSFNAAMALCERGLETVHVGDAVEKYRFSTDKRLFMRHFFRWDHEGVESILRSIESDILIVMGSASLIWNTENPVLQQRIKVLKDRNGGDAAVSGCKTRVEWIPFGTHHLHLEEDTVAAVADVLKEFVGIDQ
ncbi:hypothetical protein CcCBS67573_g05055 [Chytriomyces confervae]|uniref:AB hydrolase-1 domain-containing protein n=1 Tax=Chytriomyces confervae TaxID=246404 RepID=A0A507FBF4_9FUNG|nr:hypothetical protein CcCBS67573_g05055 [Chytriomyces confervae]